MRTLFESNMDMVQPDMLGPGKYDHTLNTYLYSDRKKVVLWQLKAEYVGDGGGSVYYTIYFEDGSKQELSYFMEYRSYEEMDDTPDEWVVEIIDDREHNYNVLFEDYFIPSSTEEMIDSIEDSLRHELPFDLREDHIQHIIDYTKRVLAKYYETD